MINQEKLIQNGNASSQRASTTNNTSCSNKWSTTSTKDGEEIDLSTSNKSLPITPVIKHKKVTQPTNANVNDCKRQFACKDHLSKDDMFTP